MRILVTGAAGFIGFHVAQILLRRGDAVVGADNLNAYYDVALKEARLKILREFPQFEFQKIDLADRAATEKLFSDHAPFDRVIHLAAQAGVRWSLTHPRDYLSANIDGFLNILEAARAQQTAHLVYASSSSVYGGNAKLPFSAEDNVDHPLSLYAATKKSNELMAHCYSHLYQIPTTGLRFFTVYGPWGRPDMALFLFARAIIERRPIEVFNHGKMRRDFTYIDDIAEGVVRVVDKPAAPDKKYNPQNPSPASGAAPYRVYNIGNRATVELNEFIAEIEKALGLTAEKIYLPMQAGDVQETLADVGALERDFNWRPATPVAVGIANFIRWYREYYGN
jgi:UDP-glucuronate 4-epimerase